MIHAKYILRIDDVCPTMKWEPFAAIINACQKLDINPILGVIPDNQDTTLVYEAERKDFWEYIKHAISYGAIIAQHGYQHQYVTKHPGLVNIHTASEFAGLSYAEQYKKIETGQKILKDTLGMYPTWFMAPSHSLDRTTCSVLRDLHFTHITDGIALFPYAEYNLTWIPQQLWSPKNMPFGVWTICIHSNTISATSLASLLAFLTEHQRQFQHVSLKANYSLMNPVFRLLWYCALYLHRI